MDLKKYGAVLPNQRKAYPTFLYFGAPKTGKSSAALTHPRPLVIDSERGSYELSLLPANTGRVEAARNFPTIDTGGDIGIFMDVFDQMDKDGVFTNKDPEIDSIIFDSSTRIYDAIKDEYADEKDNPNDSIFGGKIALREYATIKAPLRRMMRIALHAPYHKVHIMHEALTFKMNPKTKQMEVDGSTFKGEGSIIYDASVVVRTYIENGKFMGEVLYDRTHTYRPGSRIENPGWPHWRPFYERGGVEDPRAASIRMEADGDKNTISSRVNAVLADPEIIELFKQSGIPEEGWRVACEKYNGDRNMIAGKLKARIDDLSNQPK